MTRDVTCVDSTNTSLVLSSHKCTAVTRPNTVEICIQAECGKWHYSDWTEVGQH